MTIRNILLYILFFTQLICVQANVLKYSLPIPEGMNRADLYYMSFKKVPDIIIILCPGVNGNGKYLLHSNKWQEFAVKYNLGLMAISFSSSYDDLRENNGYYRADLYSGEILKKATKAIYKRDVKLLLYGFSGGAHFVSKFVDTYPNDVISWVAYSAMWKDKPRSHKINPYGLIICGEKDIRLGASLSYFQKGRLLNKPWLWLMVPNNGHSPNQKAENFIRLFFKESIKMKEQLLKRSALHVDINDRQLVPQKLCDKNLMSTAWVLNQIIYSEWRKFYE